MKWPLALLSLLLLAACSSTRRTEQLQFRALRSEMQQQLDSLRLHIATTAITAQHSNAAEREIITEVTTIDTAGRATTQRTRRLERDTQQHAHTAEQLNATRTATTQARTATHTQQQATQQTHTRRTATPPLRAILLVVLIVAGGIALSRWKKW